MRTVELDIQRFSQFGEGVGQVDGRSVFVHGVIPGERVRILLDDSQKIWRGTLEDILTPAASRRTPGCGLSHTCGGCDWLFVAETDQRAAKQEIVLSTLEHLAGIPRESLQVQPVLSSPRAMGYRRRAVLHFHQKQLSLHQRGTHTSVHLDHCPALVAILENVPGKLSPLLAPLAADSTEVHLLAEGDQAAFAVFFKGSIPARHLETAEKAVRALGMKGAVLVPKEGSPRILGKPALKSLFPLRPEIPLYVRPDAFSQANAEGNVGLVTAATVALGAADNDDVLELFSGNGNFTFALAGTARNVLGVESSFVSVELAQRSAREGQVSNIRFIQGDVDKVCEGLRREGRQFTKMLADPPRTGMPSIARVSESLGVKRVVYVACDASALGRDAKALVERGYQAEWVQVVDMFPQTRHVETVMSFSRP